MAKNKNKKESQSYLDSIKQGTEHVPGWWSLASILEITKKTKLSHLVLLWWLLSSFPATGMGAENWKTSDLSNIQFQQITKESEIDLNKYKRNKDLVATP